MWVFLFHIFLFPLSTPFITDSTIITTTKVNTPEVIVNVSDTGESVDFGITMGPSTSTASLLRDTDPNIFFGDDQEAFQDFTFSPSTVHQTSDDDEAPMT